MGNSNGKGVKNNSLPRLLQINDIHEGTVEMKWGTLPWKKCSTLPWKKCSTFLWNHFRKSTSVVLSVEYL